MAAAPASQPEAGEFTEAVCVSCQSPLGGELAPHVCARCGMPQPLKSTVGQSPLPGGLVDDPFVALGAPRRFGLDLASLEQRFYALSRALHPDRFSALSRTPAGADALKNSVDRMSFLNRAYRVLKDPAQRRQEILALEGFASAETAAGRPGSGSSGAQLPIELAEAWFDLQDAMMEDPEAARPKVAEFERELQGYLQSQDGEIAALERAYDASPSRAPLEKLNALLKTRSYLSSLERDLRRKLGG